MLTLSWWQNDLIHNIPEGITKICSNLNFGPEVLKMPRMVNCVTVISPDFGNYTENKLVNIFALGKNCFINPVLH